MQIADGQIVTIEYTLRDASGKVLETNVGKAPVTFQLGSKRMLPGLAAALEGMRVGDVRKGVIPPGQLVPKNHNPTRRVPLTEFPDRVSPKLGDRFQARGVDDAQPVVFEVFARHDDAVEVYLLHPLHDVEVHYEVKVLAARRASLPPPPPVDVPDLSGDLDLVTED